MLLQVGLKISANPKQVNFYFDNFIQLTNNAANIPGPLAEAGFPNPELQGAKKSTSCSFSMQDAVLVLVTYPAWGG